MTKRMMAPTLTKRISKARRSIRRIGGIPTATERKARLLRAKSFTEAIYASSISPANKTELRTTQSAIIAARAFSDTPTKDLDLNTAIITYAIGIFRRMTQGSECNDGMASSIAKHYMTRDTPAESPLQSSSTTCTNGKRRSMSTSGSTRQEKRESTTWTNPNG